MSRPYRRVDLTAKAWGLNDVAIPVRFLQRLVGLNARDVDAVLVRSSAVHTMTMHRPLSITSIAADGTVLATQVVPPFRFVYRADAAWILETDTAVAPPRVGARLEVVASSPDAWNPHRVRNAHRKPR